MNSISKRLQWLVAVFVLLSPVVVQAAAEPWPSAGFKYYARQTTLVRVLSDFSQTFGIGLACNADVDGKVTGDFSARTPTEFLNSLGSSHGFNWYYRAGVLYVSPANDWATQVLHVGMAASDVSALKSELTRLGLFEPRFGWAEFPARGIVVVSGPQTYVARITEVLDKLGTGPSDGRQLRVFHLQNARAEDYTFSYQDRSIVTPGVATLLRNLAAGSIAQQAENPSTGPLSVAPAIVQPVQALPALEGDVGLARMSRLTPMSYTAPVAPVAPTAPAAPAARGNVAVNAGINALSPVIVADPRLNSVVVYDAPEKMPIYEALIRELDAGRPQIQIEAMIVDIATDKIDTLGVAWRVGAGSVSAGFGGGSGAEGQGNLISVNTDAFFARVRALVTEGNARVLGRPSVLTLDNLSAVLSLSETLYVRVSGLGENRKGDSYGALVPITTGTLLRVIPRMVDESGHRNVSLAVEIQDGQILRESEDNGNGGLPTVKESSINTQAVVRENDSLVIGGYFTESDMTVERRVPGLGRVPVLGALFRDRTGEHKRSARLFLIRPSIVPASATLAAAATSGE
ncbi:MAG: type III secretion system outer membrane ring subunit SctC [Gammaproteobacteria bacterium]